MNDQQPIDKPITTIQLWKRRERIQQQMAKLTAELKEIDSKLRSELEEK